MLPEVQEEVGRRWERVNSGNVEELADIRGFREEFLQYHGFDVPGIDYSADVEP